MQNQATQLTKTITIGATMQTAPVFKKIDKNETKDIMMNWL
jgi:hypothetical protein